MAATNTDSVYAGATGFSGLSPWNRVYLIATIVLFLVLSLISGREIWYQYYGRLSRTATHGDGSGSAANGTSAATAKTSYATPKHGYSGYGGVGTPSTHALHSGGSANGTTTAATATTSLLDDEASTSLSTGAEMRQRFFLLLFTASTIRVFSLIIEVTTLPIIASSPAASLYARLLTMFLWIPSLLFVSMYGLMLLFWAQLCYACWGKAYPWPRRIFFVFNVMLYITFIVLLAVTSTSGSFWRACDVMLGVVYLIGLVGILYYSIRLIQFFRNQGPDEDFFFDLPTTRSSSPYRQAPASPRQIVLRRIMAVCVLLSILFTVKAIYLVGMGIGYVPSVESQFRSPMGIHHIAFEFTMHFFTEFVPSALLIFFTRKQSKPPLTRAQSGGSATQQQHTASSYTLRARNNSAHSGHGGNLYQDDSTGSGSLNGYQYQAAQRTYGSAAMRGGSGQTSPYVAADPSGNSSSTTHGAAASSASSTSYV